MQPTETLSSLPSKSTFDNGDLIPIVDSVDNRTKTVTKGVVAASLVNATTGWNSIGFNVSYVSNNGNKEYTVAFSGDVTSFLGPGMKFSATRGTAPPAQSMNFTAASSQSASKTSPTGITFTGPFTLEGNVNSSTIKTADIISRTNSTYTAGVFLEIINTGQVRVGFGNGSSTTIIDSAQSIPLKRRVHVAAVVTSVTSPAATIYIDGYPVVSTVTTSGATSISQSGSLMVGGNTLANSNYFDGSASELRMWSTARTATQIKDNMDISLTGTETGLEVLIQGNGNFNDKVLSGATPRNSLTPSGAIATQAWNPFNATETAIITKVGAYSGGVTLVNVSTGETCSIPNMTLTNAQYSIAATPLGLPNDLSATVGRRLLHVPIAGQQQTTSTSIVQFPPITNLTFNIPQNCSAIKLYMYAESSGAQSTGVMTFYNGSISVANKVAQANVTNPNNNFNMVSLIRVVPGSTFTLNAGWSVGGGTFIWGGASADDQAIWIETA